MARHRNRAYSDSCDDDYNNNNDEKNNSFRKYADDASAGGSLSKQRVQKNKKRLAV